MSYVEHSVTIDAPASVVWRLMSDVARWPEWTPTMRRIEPRGSGDFGAGGEAFVAMRGGARSTWRVTEWLPQRGFTWESAPMPGMRMVAGHAIAPSGGGALVTLSISTSGPIAVLSAPLLMAISRRNIRLESEGLKRRSEELARARA